MMGKETMNDDDDNNSSADEQAGETGQTADTVNEAFPGFSERLNYFIDLADPTIPAMDNGRQACISNLLQASKMAPGEWL